MGFINQLITGGHHPASILKHSANIDPHESEFIGLLDMEMASSWKQRRDSQVPWATEIAAPSAKVSRIGWKLLDKKPQSHFITIKEVKAHRCSKGPRYLANWFQAHLVVSMLPSWFSSKCPRTPSTFGHQNALDTPRYNHWTMGITVSVTTISFKFCSVLKQASFHGSSRSGCTWAIFINCPLPG